MEISERKNICISFSIIPPWLHVISICVLPNNYSARPKKLFVSGPRATKFD